MFQRAACTQGGIWLLKDELKGELLVDKEANDQEDSLAYVEIDDHVIDMDHEIDHHYFEIEDDQDTTIDRRKSIILKIISSAVLLAFIVIIWSEFFGGLKIPLDFLTKSLELSKNPTIQGYQRAVAMLKNKDRQATGFNIDSNGLIITNAHVIEGTEKVDVSFQDGSFYRGSVLASYPDVDLAVIQIDGRNLPRLELNMNYDPATGDEVMIIGNPQGFVDVVTIGTIAGAKKLQGWNVPVLMIEGHIRRGSSGSPVLNSKGQVIAVIFGTIELTAIDNKEETIGLAVPINNLNNFINKHYNKQK